MTTVEPKVSRLRLATPVKDLESVTPRQAAGYARLRIGSVSDLVRHLPVRYEQQVAERPIGDLPVGANVSARGLIVATRVVPPDGSRPPSNRRAKTRFEATLEDASGRLTVIWFHAPYLQNRLYPGLTVRVRGKVAVYRGNRQMVNPNWELIDPQDPCPLEPQRLRPVYRATDRLPSASIEKLIGQTLPRVWDLLVDPLPGELLHKHALAPLAEAYRMAHFPADEQDPPTARRRLAFNELLLLGLGIALKRKYNQTRLAAPALRWSAAIDQHIRGRFPFDLTDAQNRVIDDITGDLKQTKPMNRLVQGDVGSGKTVVALYALLLSVANRKQGALMAPTEILAEQHYLSISNMLSGSNVRIGLLCGGQSTSGSVARAAVLGAIAHGQVDIVIGTQALVSEAVSFKNLAVVVIDEQHRFGVLQRAAFRTDSGPGGRGVCGSPLERQPCPHYLVMTATPIPRTLSLTVFGDLDVSTIDRLPPGRTPTVCRVVRPQQADKVYRHVAERVNRGEQAYVVVPAIDGRPTGTDGGQGGGSDRALVAKQLKNVRAQARLLAAKYFDGRTVGIIHGRMKRSVREAVMDRFRRGRIDCLVATTVIEVGVDVPNATLMVIEHAERFGLAQLHQLRGRVGRSSNSKASLCVFIAEPLTEESTKRLKAIAQTNDGFEISEHDLAIRGMGDFFGTRQHGLPPLRVANIPEDMGLLRLARRDAKAIVDADPTLADPSHRLLRRVLLQQYGDMLGLIDVG